jgi:hypothetical protein
MSHDNSPEWTPEVEGRAAQRQLREVFDEMFPPEDSADDSTK